MTTLSNVKENQASGENNDAGMGEPFLFNEQIHDFTFFDSLHAMEDSDLLNNHLVSEYDQELLLETNEMSKVKLDSHYIINNENMSRTSFHDHVECSDNKLGDILHKNINHCNNIDSISLVHNDNRGILNRSNGPIQQKTMIDNIGKLGDLVTLNTQSYGQSSRMNKYVCNINGDGQVPVCKKMEPKVCSRVISERRRRQKLNEKLYSLRVLVPMISKMDKASIILDAINYVKTLEHQIQEMQDDISWHEGAKDQDRIRSPLMYIVMSKHGKKLKYKVLKIEVTHMDGKIYNIQINCKRSLNIFIQLSKAIDCLEFHIITANLVSVNDDILNTFVVQVNNKELLQSKDITERVYDILLRFGFDVHGCV